MSDPARHATLHRPAPGDPALRSSCRLTPVDGGAPFLLIVGEPSGLAEGDVLEVEDSDLSGTHAEFAVVVEFDGPRSAEQVAAERFATRERVAPAAAQVPGTGGAIVLRRRDGAMTVVAFGESPEALEDASRTILSTPLLPGEDLALLTGPDRITVCRAEGASALPSLVPARGTS